MFFISFAKYYPQFKTTGYDTYNNCIYDIPMQLSPYFLKQDETTGKAREVTINDNLQIVKINASQMPSYIQLKDVLFFGRQNCGYINRDLKHFITPELTYRENNLQSIGSGTAKGNIIAIPNIIFFQDNAGNDYVALGNKLNWNDFSMTTTYVLGTTNTITASKYYNPQYNNILYLQFYNDLMAKINALIAKYDSSVNVNPNQWYWYRLKDGNYMITSYRQYYGFITNSTKPFKDAFMKDKRAEIQAILAENGYSINKQSDAVHYVSTHSFYPYLMRHAKKYNTYDKSKYFLGLSHCGKFEIYSPEIRNEMPPCVVMTLPLHKVGLLVAWTDPANSTEKFKVPLGNFCFNKVWNNIDASLEYNVTLWNGHTNRSVRNRWNFRQNGDFYTQNGYVFSHLTPSMLAVSISDDKKVNLLSLFQNAINWWGAPYNYFYTHTTLMNAEVYRTPKNKDYDYFSLDEVPIDFFKDVGDVYNIDRVTTGVGTPYNSNYPWMDVTQSLQPNIAVLQRNFSGKTTLSNLDELLTIAGTTNADITCNNFRDWELFNCLDIYRSNNKFSTSQTQADMVNIPKLHLQNRNTALTTSEQLKQQADNVLVDGIFDHFNEIFDGALVYIVDTKILSAYGMNAPEYHKFMPNKCIWFEVDDLYLYTTDGKLNGYNTKYVNAAGEFIYDMQQFTKFKARYFENTKEVIWDTKKANSTDFVMRLNLQTKIGLSNLASVSEFYISMWKPYQTAIKRIEVKLDTEATA